MEVDSSNQEGSLNSTSIVLWLVEVILWYIQTLIYLYTLWTEYKLLIIIAIAVLILFCILYRTGLLYQLFHKVEVHSVRHGGELVAEVLKEHNVKFLFTLVGGHISPILVASEKIGIRVIDTRHEASAVFAADAVSRLSGTVGVAAVTAGPGLTNTVTAVKNAQMAESPLLLLGGAAATILKGRGSLQDIDQMALVQSLCKFTSTIRSVREIVPTLRKAIKIAQSGTPGPVFVEFPIDCLYPYSLVRKEIGLKSQARSLGQIFINMYLKYYLRNIFSGAFEDRNLSPLPIDRLFVSKSKVQKFAEIISRAKKPLFLIGSQATLPPTPADNVRQALESLGIPCFLGGMARGLLGRNSSIHIRHNRKQALQEADVVILAGMVCDFRLSYGRVFNRRSKILAVNRDKGQLLRNADMFWSPKLATTGDPGNFLVALQQKLTGFTCDQEWVGGLKEKDLEKDQDISTKAEVKTEYHLNPLKVLMAVESVMADDSIIVADGGDFVGSAAYILRPRGPLKWLDPGPFGTLGVGGGFALGAKLCCPDSEVWIMYGDGSSGYSIAEYDTFTRHNTPVIAVIGNDAGWTQISRDQVPLLGINTACGLEYCDYHVVAQGYGGKGFKLDRGTEKNMEGILRTAQKECKAGHSVLINALIGRTDFREGSIAV